MNVKLDTEVIDILKGFVILGTEVSNTLSSTDSEDTKAKNTMPKEKKKLKDHKFKTQVDSHFRVLFPSINLSVSSSDVNDLHKNPEKCSQFLAIVWKSSFVVEVLLHHLLDEANNLPAHQHVCHQTSVSRACRQHR